ncbi:hypothetical protein KKF64_01480 [Patescibacteria group bacterium]|nr:hypothetical protein [Patescibacteria group bacterium]
MSKKQKKEQMQILISVALSMIIIISMWAIWFYPASISTNNKSSLGFTKFTKDIINSLSIFQDKSNKEAEIDVDDLRERVFGDKIER